MQPYTLHPQAVLMKATPMQNDDLNKAPFYDELMEVLAEVNPKRAPGDQVSFRRAVVEGLRLRDSFTSKIKVGTYKPTLDRLVNLASLLGVHPSRFASYSRRLHMDSLNDARFVRLFVILSRLSPRAYDLIVDAMLKIVEKMVQEARVDSDPQPKSADDGDPSVVAA